MLYHIFFPNRCLLCDDVTFYDRIHCDSCVSKIEIIKTRYKITTQFCECYAPYYYFDDARNSLIAFKFETEHKKEKVRKFSWSMVNCLANNNLIFEFDMIMYIPKYNEVKDTFNTSRELALSISKITNKPLITDVLVKTKETPKQHLSSYENRFTNLIGAFNCNYPQVITGKRILLIDDVCTSGSTFNVCAQTLLYYGAKKVIGLSATIKAG